jgi:hypothetical protein
MLFYFENHNNNISGNLQSVYFLSMYSKNKCGLPCGEKNIRVSIALFIARRLKASAFDIHDNVYLAPILKDSSK